MDFRGPEQLVDFSGSNQNKLLKEIGLHQLTLTYTEHLLNEQSIDEFWVNGQNWP